MKNTTRPSQQFTPDTRVVGYTAPVRIMVANAKGGCGKSTLATNIASYFANEECKTAIVDYDPQGSSIDWLKVRGEHLPAIQGIEAYKKHQANYSTRTWALRVEPHTQRVVIDTPAGLCGNELSDLIQQSDIIVIPVIPSAIDIRAATRFISDVLLSLSFRMKPKPITVVANRVRKNTLIYSKLERFLSSLNIPFITSLRDTQQYVRASEHGLGVVDLHQRDQKEKNEWQPLVQWLNSTAFKIDEQWRLEYQQLQKEQSGHHHNQ